MSEKKYLMSQDPDDVSKPTVQDSIHILAAEILNTDKEGIPVDKSLFDIGFDSLTMIRLVGAIQGKYQHLISARDLFENPTIEELARVLQQRASTEENGAAEFIERFNSNATNL